MQVALIEVSTMRRLAGIELIRDRIIDETTTLSFRHLLEKHDLDQQILKTLKTHLKKGVMAMKQTTIIDVTLISAPSYTKNKTDERDPEIHQTKKSNRWYYGMESAYRRRQRLCLIHSIESNSANVHEINRAASYCMARKMSSTAMRAIKEVKKRPEVSDKRITFQVTMRSEKRRALPTPRPDSCRI